MFPKPYKNEVPKSEDPIMIGVPKDKMGIGARSSGLPKGGVNSSGMNLDHVGGSSGKKG
jgi:hypothetical protein